MALAQWQQAQSAGQAVAWAEELNFTRDALGNLLSEENHGGLWQYQYDALGNLSQSSRPDGRSLNFLRYVSGHLLQLNLQHAGQNQEVAAYQRDALHREIVRSQGALSLETRYDRVGRIVMRRSPVLGRRTQKILHRHGESPDDAGIVTFHWTDLQMVGEQSSRQPARSTHYIYAEGGWEPLARVDSVGESGETYWYHSELNGLPERMTDPYGEVVWQGSFSTWGETERESSPRGLKQNLRFQGQYFDAETGLNDN